MRTHRKYFSPFNDLILILGVEKKKAVIEEQYRNIVIPKGMNKRVGPVALLPPFRIFIIVLCVVSILWVPVLKDLEGGQMFYYLQAVHSYFTPPIAAVYLLAVFWKRSNEKVSGERDI